MNRLYYKKKKIGRVLSVQFFNHQMMICYVDRDGKFKDTPAKEGLFYGRPRTRLYQVIQNFKSKLRHAKTKVQARFSKN